MVDDALPVFVPSIVYPLHASPGVRWLQLLGNLADGSCKSFFDAFGGLS